MKNLLVPNLERQIYMKRYMNILVKSIIILGIGILAAVYYYHVHLGFTPNGEELLSVTGSYIQARTNEGLLGGGSNRPLYFMLSHMVNLFGVSYKALRMTQAILWGALVTLSMLVIFMNTKKIKDSIGVVLPVFIVLMVLVNKGKSNYYGWIAEGRIHVYPMDPHICALIFAVFGLICIQIYDRSRKKSGKTLASLLIVLSMIVGILNTDALFFLIYILPVICFYGIKLFERVKNKEKFCLSIVGLGTIVLFFLRIIYYTTPYLSELFQEKQLRYGDWEKYFYGVPTFLRMDNLAYQIKNYFMGLLGLFDIDISGKAVIDIYLIWYTVRFILLVCTVILVYKTLRDWWQRKPIKGVNIVMALGIIFNSLAVLFTGYGEGAACARYMTVILPYSSILLCSEIPSLFENIREFSGIQFLRYKHFIAGTMAIVIFVFATPAKDLHKNPDVWDEEYASIVEVIQENNLGTGISSVWIAPVISCLSEGKTMVGTARVDLLHDEFKLIQPTLIEKKQDIIENKEYYYLIIEKEPVQWYDFTCTNALTKLGNPVAVYSGKRDLLNIYLYDYNIAERFIK